MKQWLRSAPDKPPAEPEHIDIMQFYAGVTAAEEEGRTIPKYVAYIQKNGPSISRDEWGIPLPLSSMQQNLLDRLVAICKDPLNRLRLLILSGLVNPDEIEAVERVYPEIYKRVVDAALKDMIETKPPFQVWAQSTLGVLFKKPANLMYAEEQAQEAGAQPGNSPTAARGDTMPTQVDRREIAIRQQGR